MLSALSIISVRVRVGLHGVVLSARTSAAAAAATAAHRTVGRAAKPRRRVHTAAAGLSVFSYSRTAGPSTSTKNPSRRGDPLRPAYNTEFTVSPYVRLLYTIIIVPTTGVLAATAGYVRFRR